VGSEGGDTDLKTVPDMGRVMTARMTWLEVAVVSQSSSRYPLPVLVLVGWLLGRGVERRPTER